MTDASNRASDLDQYPVGLVDCDAVGRITYMNAQMRDWVPAASGESLLGKPFYGLLSPAGRIYFETHLRPMLMIEGVISEISLDLLAPAGQRKCIYLSGRTKLDADGQIVSLHLVCFSGDDRRRYEEELLLRRRKAEAYEAMVAASPDAIINVDTQQRIQSWNDAAERLLGYCVEEALGQQLYPFIIADDRRVENEEQMQAVANGEAVTVDTARLHKDGSSVPVEASIAGINDEKGTHIGAISILRDITERQRNEATIQTLNREVVHRSKNLLAVVNGIASMTLRSTPQDAFAEVFQNRLASLGKSLNLLVERSWGNIALDVLIARQLDHLGEKALSQVRVDGPKVEIEPYKAEAIGMAIFELSTNAIKYGALSNPDGRIEISWQQDIDDQSIVMQWCEQTDAGCTPPTREGFGSKLTGVLLERAVMGQVMADYTPEGLHWQCKFIPD